LHRPKPKQASSATSKWLGEAECALRHWDAAIVRGTMHALHLHAPAAHSCLRPAAPCRQPARALWHPAAAPAQRRLGHRAPSGRGGACQALRAAGPRGGVVCAASQAVGKFISKTPIPAFIPRQDLMDQMLRWATFEASDPDALARYNLPLKVAPFYTDGGSGRLWGITVAFIKDGMTMTTLGVKFDDEEVVRHEWVGRGADGFPTLEGNSEDVLGANLEIRCAARTPPAAESRLACARAEGAERLVLSALVCGERPWHACAGVSAPVAACLKVRVRDLCSVTRRLVLPWIGVNSAALGTTHTFCISGCA